MTGKTSGSRLPTVLWFIAAGLAFVAVAIRLSDGRGLNFSTAAAGLFFLIMGILGLRSRKPPQT